MPLGCLVDVVEKLCGASGRSLQDSLEVFATERQKLYFAWCRDARLTATNRVR